MLTKKWWYIWVFVMLVFVMLVFALYHTHSTKSLLSTTAHKYFQGAAHISRQSEHFNCGAGFLLMTVFCVIPCHDFEAKVFDFIMYRLIGLRLLSGVGCVSISGLG